MAAKEEEFQNQIPYQFKDMGLLKRALTHSSFANECRNSSVKDNERLEFLGDAVLEIVVSDFLFRHYPDEQEGVLSKKRVEIVCEPTLDMCARAIHLSDYIYLGKGEEQTGGRRRPSIVSDAMEAVIGAVYLDGGFEAAFSYVEEVVLKEVKGKQLYQDAKTALQEKAVADGDGEVRYEQAGFTGPDHNRTFYVNLYIGGRKVTSASGHSKKAAEQQAAYEALLLLNQKETVDVPETD